MPHAPFGDAARGVLRESRLGRALDRAREERVSAEGNARYSQAAEPLSARDGVRLALYPFEIIPG
jgi:hypothetical protein